MKTSIATLIALAALSYGAARAEPAVYKIDDDHTYATFAIDHSSARCASGRRVLRPRRLTSR